MGNSIKVLIGDDSALMRKSLRDILQEAGCNEIFEATNGQEAIDIYKKENPDIVFLDIVMPLCDGIEATQQICKHDSNAHIIIVSSVGTQSLLKNAIQSGAKDFIQKPFKSELIKKVIYELSGGNN